MNMSFELDQNSKLQALLIPHTKLMEVVPSCWSHAVTAAMLTKKYKKKVVEGQ